MLKYAETSQTIYSESRPNDEHENEELIILPKLSRSRRRNQKKNSSTVPRRRTRVSILAAHFQSKNLAKVGPTVNQFREASILSKFHYHRHPGRLANIMYNEASQSFSSPPNGPTNPPTELA
jgi:hypothetical protein